MEERHFQMRALSVALETVVNQKERLKLGDFILAAGDRAFGIVLVILALPSALPIPGTGISTPLGVGIVFIAGQMILGRKHLWLPQKVLNLPVSKKFAHKMTKSLSWILKKFERFIRPRVPWIKSRAGHVVFGILVIALACLMQLPLPLTNTMPAMVVFCLAIALTEDDGLLAIIFSVVAVFLVAAYIAGFAAIIFFGFSGLKEVLNYVVNFI